MKKVHLKIPKTEKENVRHTNSCSKTTLLNLSLVLSQRTEDDENNID